MKRIWPIAALSVLAAAPIASSGDPGAPSADLKVTPATVTEGETVTLDASASRDDGAIAGYAFDADGDGTFEPAGTQSSIQQPLSTPGEVRLGVRVVDDTGLSADAFQSVTVSPKPQPKEVAAAPEPAAEPAAEPKPKKIESKSAPEPEPEPAAEPEPARKDTTVRAAASATVSIRDFSFAPRSVTVNVGDSVTWRNAGDEPHTATGSGFDTGSLASGASGSHRFASAGTFSYKCTPHPFMTGTVRVVAAGSGGGSGGGTGSPSNGGGASTDGGDAAGSSGSDGDLPSTGFALGALVLPGCAMLLAGLALRRRLAVSSG